LAKTNVLHVVRVVKTALLYSKPPSRRI